MTDEEFNPYAASDAPVAAEVVEPSRIRFYMICLACAIGLVAVIIGAQALHLPQTVGIAALPVTWLVGVLWILQLDLRKPGGIRNVSLKQLIVTIFGVPVFTGTLMIILLIVASLVLSPFLF
jgi:hypothetical protein